MRDRLDELRREFSRLLDALTIQERIELRELEPDEGWRKSGGVSATQNVVTALDLIATAEDEERDGTLPHGAAQNLRGILRQRLA
jgi:hypothetical protein